jgi:hypothetical protein
MNLIKKLSGAILICLFLFSLFAMNVHAVGITSIMKHDFEGTFDPFEYVSPQSNAINSVKFEQVSGSDSISGSKSAKMTILNDGDYTQKQFVLDKNLLKKSDGYTAFAIRIKWNVKMFKAKDDSGNTQHAYINFFADSFTQNIMNGKTNINYVKFYNLNGTTYSAFAPDHWLKANYPMIPVKDGVFNGWAVVDFAKANFSIPEGGKYSVLCTQYNDFPISEVGFGLMNCKKDSTLYLDDIRLLKGDISNQAELLKMLNNGIPVLTSSPASNSTASSISSITVSSSTSKISTVSTNSANSATSTLSEASSSEVSGISSNGSSDADSSISSEYISDNSVLSTNDSTESSGGDNENKDGNNSLVIIIIIAAVVVVGGISFYFFKIKK